MSLTVDGGKASGRSRSRSRSRDRRSKDEPSRDKHAITYADTRESSYVYPEDDLDSRPGKSSSSRRTEYHEPLRSPGGSSLPYPAHGGLDSMLPGSRKLYDYDRDDDDVDNDYDQRRSAYRTASPPTDSSHRRSQSHLSGAPPGAFPEDGYTRGQGSDEDRRTGRHEASRGSKYDDYKRPRYDHREDDEDDHHRRKRPEEPRSSHRDSAKDFDKLSFLPSKYSRQYDDSDNSRKSGSDRDRKADRHQRKKERDEDDLAYGKIPTRLGPGAHDSETTYGSYFSGSQLKDRITGRRDGSPDRKGTSRAAEEDYDRRRSHRLSHKDDARTSYRDDARTSATNVLTVEPRDDDRHHSSDRRRDRSPRPSGLTVDTGNRERDRSRDRRSGHNGRDKSPQPPTARLSTLSVGDPRPSHTSLAAAPGSPLLESYHGTYQQISPMPSPLLLASSSPMDDPQTLESLSPGGSDVEGEKKRNRRARFHDPEDIATRLAKALKGDRSPDVGPLIEILPSLTHTQVMELRTEYKRLVKTGADRKGVNIAKHIRSRLKDEDSKLMKACYAVALGKWESEAYWANFWYQGDKTRRELLIESLMGRTNDEIRAIKDAFTDKKYDNSLTKCMKTELKEDKFKKAILMVLDERRMDEYDAAGRRNPLDYELVDDDVRDLYKAVKAEKGGESQMISIVIQRSDTHLRAVLKEYERQHHGNFARDALKKSGNLVGEVLAHILNGIINQPVRDALLLHHALTASRKDELRRELLTSRLVRYHWDNAHMVAVRKAYRERYGRDLQEAVKEATSGEWGEFCRELCIARVPTEVRRVERVQGR